MPTEMELTLEQTQQGVSYEVSRVSLEIRSDNETVEYDESNMHVLERFNTTARNPVKKILLKLNLSDHRSILTDVKALGMVKLEIGGNVNFEIKSQFMRELREDTFSGNKNKDVHDHVDRVLNIWHDGTSSRNVSSNSNTDGLAVIISKLDNLGHDMKKLKENVHAIQVGCQICEGPHLDKECPLNREVKQLEEVKYGEFRRSAPFNRSNEAKFCVGPSGYYTRTDNRPPYGEMRPSLEELMNKHQEESARTSAEMKE
ncbi:hypothetical protein Tco_1525657 [Tanacetum coccineum]